MKIQISALISKAALLLMITIASILMPFNIYADTAIIVGTDVSVIDSTLVRTETYTASGGTGTATNMTFTYKVTAQLDNNYVGYLLLKMDYSYYNNPQSGLRVDSGSVTRRVFINGDKAEFNFIINTWYASDPLLRNTTNATPNVVIQDQGVTLLSELDSIQQIIDILQDLYSSTDQIEGLLNNQLQQLELVVSNTTLANQYLDSISKIRSWNIPLESYSINSYILDHYSTFEKVYFDNNSYIENYPCVKTQANKPLYSTYLGENPNGFNNKMTFVVISNMNLSTLNQIYTMFIIDNSIYTVSNYNYLDYFNGYYLIKFDVSTNRSGTFNLIPKYSNDYFIGIMAKYTAFADRVSTDFALRFGLSNQLLNDIHIIAQGTQASNQQSQDLSSGTDSMQDQMDDLVGIEDSYNQQFNNSVNSIDFNNPLQQNQGLLGASNFVITVFNGLIANNPFSILIIIVCILLIGKKVIGK